MSGIVTGALVVIPIRTVNPLNGSHGNWHAKARRVREEREATAWALRAVPAPDLPCVVTLTRVALRAMDTDGLAASNKAVRDEVAIWLGLPTNKRGHADDADPRVEWRYEQRKGAPGEYAVEVMVEVRA